MATTQDREHSSTDTERSSDHFALLELTSEDVEFLALNQTLARSIADTFVERLYLLLQSDSHSGSPALEPADLERSKAEYKSYFLGLFEETPFQRDVENSEFVHGLDSRYYLTALPAAVDLFAELALDNPDRSLDHPVLAEGHMPELVRTVSTKLWGDALTAANSYTLPQEELASAVVSESNKWQKLASTESLVMSRISEAIQESAVIDQATTELVGEAIREIIPLDRLSISRYDVKTNVHTIGPAIGVEPYPTGHQMMVDPKQIARDYSETNVKIFDEAGIDDLITMSPSIAAAKAVGIKTLMGVALRWRGELLGFISIQSKNPNAYDKNTEATADRLGSSLAAALAAADRYHTLEQRSSVNAYVSNLVQALLSDSAEKIGLQEFARNLVDVFDSDMAAVNVFQEISSHPLLSVAYDRQTDEFDDIVASHTVTEFVLQNFLRPTATISGRDQLVRAAETFEPTRVRLQQGFVRVAAIGLEWQGKLVGSIAIWSRDESSLNEKSLELLGHIAVQVSGSIGYVRQTLRLESDFHNQVAISELADAISSAESVDAGFEKFTRLLHELYSQARVAVSIFKPNAWVITDMYAYNSVNGHVRDTNLDISIPPEVVEVVGGHTPNIITRDLMERLAPVFSPYVDRLADGSNAGVTIPLWWQGDPVGSISAFFQNESDIGEYELNLLARIATHVSGAIGYLLVNRRLESEFSDQVAITDLATALSSSESLEEGFANFTRLLRELFSADSVAVSMYAPETRSVTDIYFYDLSNGFRHEVGEFPAIPPDLAAELSDDSTNIVNLGMLEKYGPKFQPWAERLAGGTRGSMIMRLWWQGAVVGSLTIFTKAEIAFEEHDVHLLERIAEHVSGAMGNLLLNRGLEAGLDQQAALAQIGQIIGSAIDIDNVFTEVVPALKRLIEFDELRVSTLDIETSTITILFDTVTKTRSFSSSVVLPLEGTLTALTLASEKPVRVAIGPANDFQSEITTLRDPSSPEINSTVGVPLVSDGITFGAVQFRAKSHGAFDSVSDELLLQLAAQLSGVIAYHRVNERLSSELREQTALAEISRIIGSDLDIKSTFGEVEEILHKLIPFTSMYAATVDIEARIATNFYHSINDRLGANFHRSMPLDRTVMLAAVEAQKPVRIALDQDGSWSGGSPLKLSAERSERSVIGIPLISEGQIFGIVEFHSDKEDAYEDFTNELFERIGAHLSGAISYHQVNQELTQELREQSVLSRVGQIIGSGLNIDAVIEEALDTIRELIGFDSFFVNSVNTDGTSFTNLYVDEVVETVARSGMVRPLEKSLTQATITGQEPLRATIDESGKWQKEPRSLEELEHHNFVEVVSIPLISDGDIFGTIQFRSHSGISNYDEINDEFLVRLAAQLAGAISYDIVNAQLEKEATEQTTLARISQIVGSGLDIKTAFDEVAETLHGLIPFVSMFVNTVDRESGITTVAYLMVDGVTEAHLGLEIPLAGTVTGAVLEARAPVRIAIEEDGTWFGGPPLLVAARRGEKSIVGIPLISEGKIFGALQMCSDNSSAYDGLADEFLERVAAHLAGAIAYSQVNERLEREATEQATLANISRTIGSELDIKTAFDEVADTILELIPFSGLYATIIDRESETKTDIYVNNISDGTNSTVGVVIPLADTFTAAVLENQKPFRSQIDEDGNWAGAVPLKNAALRSERSVVGVPLISEGQIFGVLQFRSELPDAYSELTDDFLERFAAHIAGAIAFNQVNERLEKEATEQATLARIGQIVGSELDIDSVFDQVASTLAELVEFDVVMVTAPNDAGTMLRNQPVVGRVAETYATGEWYSIEPTIAGKTLKTKKPMREQIPLAAFSDQEGKFGRSTLQGLRSALAIPLISEGSAFAVLQFRSAKEGAYDDLSDDFLERIAEQIAGAIAYELVNERLQTELDEQTVIARISHILGASSDISAVFDEVADELKTIIDFDTILVNSFDTEAGILVVRLSSGRITDHTRTEATHKIKNSLSETIISERKPVRTVTRQEYADEYSVVIEKMRDGSNTAIEIPLISQGEVQGVLQLRSLAHNAHPRSQDRFLTLIAEQISGAMARAELSESQLILALERERAEGLESQNQQLVQLQRTREQFLGMITHELRTPLTSISAFTDILGHNKEETLTERQFQQLGAVSRNATQLSELIDDLIHMSRMERGQFELTLDRTDLVELVKQVCESMAPVMLHRNQKLEPKIDIQKLRLDLDHSRMTQVLNNLISNASKFSPTGSTVTVGMQLLDHDVQIEVTDEGPGIDADKVEAVFDPFYRIESEYVKRVPGTGLGLHVARTIVRQHGGDISVVDAGSGGTTLRIVIPLVPAG